MSAFSCKMMNEGSAAVLKVAGQITSAEVEEFEKQAIQAASSKPSKLVIDMSDVSAISSAGIGALLKIDVKMRGQKCLMRIAAPAPNIAEVFRLSRLDGVLNIKVSIAEALE